MKTYLVLIPIILTWCISTFYKPSVADQGCKHRHFLTNVDTSIQEMFPTIPENLYDSIFQGNPDFWVSGFDFPIGKPNANGYVLTQKFGQNNHLGEDWNGVGGGNTDLGDPVYSIANGLVTFSRKVCCGWGNVIRVVHFQPNKPGLRYVESVYAHLDKINVLPGQLIERGQPIGNWQCRWNLPCAPSPGNAELH